MIFTDATNSKQIQLEALNMLARREHFDGRRSSITEKLVRYSAVQNPLYFATTFVDIRPYVRHHSDPKGFLKIV